MLTELSNRLKTWFYQTPRRFLDGPDGLEEFPGGQRETLWIVPRAALVHRVFDFPKAVTEQNRDAALALQCKGWAPFETPGFAVFWSGNQASVFAWDQADQLARAKSALPMVKNPKLVPLPYIQEPMEEGCRFVACNPGFEVQLWRDGLISASRWWMDKPSEQELNHFFRSARAQPEKLAATSLDILERPWHQELNPLDQTATFLGDRTVMGAGVAVAGVVFVFLLAQSVVLMAGEAALRSSSMSDQSTFSELRQERRQAIMNQQQILAYAALLRGVDQAGLYQQVLSALESQNAQLVSWSYVPGELSILLRSDEPMDPTLYIRLLETERAFTGVSATTVGQAQDLRVEMNVVVPDALGGAS